MAFIGFGIVIVGVGVAVLLIGGDALFGATIIGLGTAGIGFGIYMLVSTGAIGRARANSDASVQDYDGQDNADG